MFSFVVAVDVGSLDIRQILELVLQIFCNIMGLFERHSGVENDVDFHSDSRTGVPSSYGVQTDDIWTVCHGDIRNPLQNMSGSGNSNQKLEFRVSGAKPEESNQTRKCDCSRGIDLPSELAASYGSQDTEPEERS